MKGGEDVRMDERMEQLLHVANGLLARHPAAASHALQVPLASALSVFILISGDLRACAVSAHCHNAAF